MSIGPGGAILDAEGGAVTWPLYGGIVGNTVGNNGVYGGLTLTGASNGVLGNNPAYNSAIQLTGSGGLTKMGSGMWTISARILLRRHQRYRRDLASE